MPVEMLDLKGVVEHVGAGGFVVGPIAGDVVDVGKFLAALGDAGAELVGAVRFDAAVPEGPGFARGGGVEEVDEVGGVVGVADAGGGRRRFAGVVGFARG